MQSVKNNGRRDEESQEKRKTVSKLLYGHCETFHGEWDKTFTEQRTYRSCTMLWNDSLRSTHDLLADSLSESLSLSADSELVSLDEEDAELELSELKPVGLLRSTEPVMAATSGLRAWNNFLNLKFCNISCHKLRFSSEKFCHINFSVLFYTSKETTNNKSGHFINKENKC